MATVAPLTPLHDSCDQCRERNEDERIESAAFGFWIHPLRRRFAQSTFTSSKVIEAEYRSTSKKATPLHVSALLKEQLQSTDSVLLHCFFRLL